MTRGRYVTLTLTPREADALAIVAGQGWGDGDHADYLGGGEDAKTCRRAMAKLDRAISDAADLRRWRAGGAL